MLIICSYEHINYGNTLLVHPRKPRRDISPCRAEARRASVLLDPAFLALADEFGMVPERMAERVLSAFAATPPSHLIVKGRKFAAQSSR